MTTPPKDTLNERPFATGIGNALGNIGSRIANSTMAAMGSASAAGRISAANATTDIYREWQRYSAPKRLGPNLRNLLLFFQQTYGGKGRTLATAALPNLARAFPGFLNGIDQEAATITTQIAAGTTTTAAAAGGTDSPQQTPVGSVPTTPATAPSSGTAPAAGPAATPAASAQPTSKTTDPALNKFFAQAVTSMTPASGKMQSDIEQGIESGHDLELRKVPVLVQQLVSQAKQEGGVALSSTKDFLSAQARAATDHPQLASFLLKVASSIRYQPAPPPSPGRTAFQTNAMNQIMAKVQAADPSTKAEVYPLVKELVQQAGQNGSDHQRVVKFLQNMRKMTESAAERRLIDLTLYLVEHKVQSATTLSEGFDRIYGRHRLHEAATEWGKVLSPKQLGWLFKDLGDTFIKNGLIKYHGIEGNASANGTGNNQTADQAAVAGSPPAAGPQPAAATANGAQVTTAILKKIGTMRPDAAALSAFLTARQVDPARIQLVSKAANGALSYTLMFKAMATIDLPYAVRLAVNAFAVQAARGTAQPGGANTTQGANAIIKKMGTIRPDPRGLTAFLTARQVDPAAIRTVSTAAEQSTSYTVMFKALEAAKLPQATLMAITAFAVQPAQSP